MVEVCDPIPDLEVPLVLVHPIVHAFVTNCQIVISHDGDDPYIIMVP